MTEGWGVIGCDPHKSTITIAAVDGTAADLSVESFPNDSDGFEAILAWLEGLGIDVIRIGIEGSSTWGRHLAVRLGEAGYDVREVPPTRTTDRRRRRRRPKTDREDALAVARETLGDQDLPPAKPTLEVCEAQSELAVICSVVVRWFADVSGCSTRPRDCSTSCLPR